MRRAIGYSLLLFWAALAAALHLALSGLSLSIFAPVASAISTDSAPTLRAMVPDLATLLLVASVGRLSRRDTLMIAIVSPPTWGRRPRLARFMKLNIGSSHVMRKSAGCGNVAAPYSRNKAIPQCWKVSSAMLRIASERRAL